MESHIDDSGPNESTYRPSISTHFFISIHLQGSQRTRYRRCSHRALYLSLIHLILAGTVCSFLLQHPTLLCTPETRYLLKRQQKNDFVHTPGREHTSVTTKCQRE